VGFLGRKVKNNTEINQQLNQTDPKVDPVISSHSRHEWMCRLCLSGNLPVAFARIGPQRGLDSPALVPVRSGAGGVFAVDRFDSVSSHAVFCVGRSCSKAFSLRCASAYL
jgi:hypothetical protein